MSEKDVEKTEHAGPEPEENTGGFHADQIKSDSGNKPPVWMWFGLGALFIVALLVIFVLPTVVSEYELPLERRVDVAVPQPAENRAQPETIVSPFEEAQRARQRKEAQDVLASLLEHQNELEALEVSSWAGEDYQAALEEAGTGDDYYRTREFVLATRSYERARDELAQLLESVPQALTRTLAEADTALQDGNAAVAEDKYSLALVLDPESEVAQIGLTRARSLEEVTELFAQAERLAEDGELEAAREVYRQIASLDSYNERAQQRIADMTTQIRQAEFGRIMSRGYALLDEGNPQQAIAAFQQAADLGVNESQARAAIVQTENEVANAKIVELRAQLTTAEAAEQWETAVDLYEQVLAIDPNVRFAVEGKDYAEKRAHLDALLTNAIDNPERVADEDVFAETVDVYYTGRAIEEPGPRLQAQLDELQGLLETSQVPIEVTFNSDNLTKVTLLREAELGLFQQTTMALKPGRYVAVGSRAGYREVRKEFVVGFGQTPQSVVVQCEERVVATSR